MRCKRICAAAATAAFLLLYGIPASAGDGKHPHLIEEKIGDHPWQDDLGKGNKSVKRFYFAIGPMQFWVTLPNIALKPAQAKTTTQVPPVQNATEKGK